LPRIENINLHFTPIICFECIETLLRFEKNRIYFLKGSSCNLKEEGYLSSDGILKETPIIPESTKIVSFSCDPEELYLEFLNTGGKSLLEKGRSKEFIYYLPRDMIQNHEVVFRLGIREKNKPIDKILPYLLSRVDGNRTSQEIIDDVVEEFSFLGVRSYMHKEISIYIYFFIKKAFFTFH
jgi:hypothetical protein